jgi:adenylate cyclase
MLLAMHSDTANVNPAIPIARRLAAVVFTDVVGYSAMVHANESEAVARVRADLDSMRSACLRHGGECLSSMGDGLMLAFPSSVEAVSFAVNIQSAFGTRNLASPVSAIRHRIGIHLGDVLRLEDGHLAGDGVNIASRLEGKAPAGGICLSQTVYDTVRGKLPLKASFGGEQALKNIAHPVPVWLIEPGAQTSAARAGAGARRLGRMPAFAIACALAAVFTLLAWHFVPAKIAVGAPAPSSEAVPATGSVVVLPVRSDPANAGKADAVRMDIVSMLARSSTILQVAEPSAQQVRDSAADAATVAHALQSRFAVDSRIEDGGHSLNAILFDAATRAEVWSERIQLPADERARRRAIHGSVWRLRGALLDAESHRVRTAPEGSGTPADDVLRADAIARTDLPQRERLDRMSRLYETALRRDPQLLSAMMASSEVIIQRLELDPLVDREAKIRRLDELTAKLVALGRNRPNPWFARAYALMYKGEFAGAVEAARTALQLEPDSAGVMALNARMVLMAGEPAQAVQIAEQADSLGLVNGMLNSARCEALLLAGNPGATTVCERARAATANDDFLELLAAAAYQAAGDTARAQRGVRELRKVEPNTSVEYLRVRRISSHPGFVKLTEDKLYTPLRQAGLPER